VRRSEGCWVGASAELRHRAAGFFGALGVALVLLSSPCIAANADADAKPAADAPELRRELAGHNFIPSRFTLDPFVSTYVGSETGGGYGSAPGRTFDIVGHVVSTDTYKVGAFAQYLDFQYGFFDWWAVRASLRIVVYTGINDPGIVGIGSSVQVNPVFGTTVSFKVGERLRLGGSFDVGSGPAVLFNVVEAIVLSVRNGELTAPLTNSSQTTFQPALVGAWAIHKSLGVTFSLAYQYTRGSGDNPTVLAHLLGANAMLDFDMNALHWIPFGLLAGFTTQFDLTETRFVSYRYNFGLFYTAVKPLNVGLEVVYARSPVFSNTHVFLSSLIGLLVIQYNFN